jgi:hypothetical protein
MMNSYVDCYTQNGRFFFEDENDVVEVSEWVDVHTLVWDEYQGYILPDGRNLRDIVID